MIFEWQERFKSFILEIKLSEQKRTVIKLTMITLSMIIHDCLHTFITYFYVLRLKPPSLNFTMATLLQLFINVLSLLYRNWKEILVSANNLHPLFWSQEVSKTMHSVTWSHRIESMKQSWLIILLPHFTTWFTRWPSTDVNRQRLDTSDKYLEIQ